MRYNYSGSPSFRDRHDKMVAIFASSLSRLVAIALIIVIIPHSKPHFTVISAHSLAEFRCSHVPPQPEQVNHVQLDNFNFTESLDERHSISNDEVITKSRSQDFARAAEFDSISTRSKRQIGSTSGTTNRNIGFHSSPHLQDDPANNEDSLWSFLKHPLTQAKHAFSAKLEQHHDDLVPMNIQVYYDSSVYALDKQKLQSINETVMPTVVKFFEEVLLIRRDYTIDKFRIARRCPNNTIYYAKESIGFSRPYCMDRCEDHAVCGEIIVPKEHLSACSYCNITSRRCTTKLGSEGKGVANTQLLLYVSAKQTVRCKRDQTIAYAAHCAQDAKTDRPVAGHANLCPSSISTDPKDLKALIATVKHELTHVLGFSVSLFAYYRDQHGMPLTERQSISGPIPIDPTTGYARWSDRVIRKVIRRGWVTGEGLVDKETHLVVTPTVVREVRRHFNCSTLEGAELEDQGSDGTSMTHWEKRLFENEAMTGTHTQNSVYSRITLAVLQDTGWYVANFTNADKLDWGRDLGCDFAKKSCKSWIDYRRSKGMSVRPFCDRVKGDLLQIGCTEDRGSKAVCNMKYYKEPLPGVYQNFDKLEDTKPAELAHFGGSVDLADYCPFIQEFTWQVQNVTVRGSRCDLGASGFESERNAALEHYGPDSRCFEHGRRWEQRSCNYKRHWHHFGAGCYRFTCSNGHPNVVVGNQTHPCFYTGQIVHIEQVLDQWLYNGSLVCPPCDKICPASRCTNYDERLIDLIMAIDFTDNTEQTLDAILDETLNSIDTNDVNNLKKTYNKYKSVLDETSQWSKKRMLRDSELQAKTSSLPFNLFVKPSTRHPLMCSGTNQRVSLGSMSMILTLLSIAIIV